MLFRLPTELMHQVGNRLDPVSLVKLASTSKTLNLCFDEYFRARNFMLQDICFQRKVFRSWINHAKKNSPHFLHRIVELLLDLKYDDHEILYEYCVSFAHRMGELRLNYNDEIKMRSECLTLPTSDVDRLYSVYKRSTLPSSYGGKQLALSVAYLANAHNFFCYLVRQGFSLDIEAISLLVGQYTPEREFLFKKVFHADISFYRWHSLVYYAIKTNNVAFLQTISNLNIITMKYEFYLSLALSTNALDAFEFMVEECPAPVTFRATLDFFSQLCIKGDLRFFHAFLDPYLADFFNMVFSMGVDMYVYSMFFSAWNAAKIFRFWEEQFAVEGEEFMEDQFSNLPFEDILCMYSHIIAWKDVDLFRFFNAYCPLPTDHIACQFLLYQCVNANDLDFLKMLVLDCGIHPLPLQGLTKLIWEWEEHFPLAFVENAKTYENWTEDSYYWFEARRAPVKDAKLRFAMDLPFLPVDVDVMSQMKRFIHLEVPIQDQRHWSFFLKYLLHDRDLEFVSSTHKRKFLWANNTFNNNVSELEREYYVRK